MTETTERTVLIGGLDVATDRIELPVTGWSAEGNEPVTGHSPAESELSREAIRKQEQRAREKAAGVVELELKFSTYERAELDEGRTGRGSQGEPYTATEYIKTLIRNDVARLRNEQGKLAGRICKNCTKPLPRGCGGVWAGEQSCLLRAAEVALSL